MPNSSTVTFQESWIKDPLFELWLQCIGQGKEAFCKLCKRIIDYKSMGRSALISHTKSKKHMALVMVQEKSDRASMFTFLNKKNTSLSCSSSASSIVQSVPSPIAPTKTTMDAFVSNSDTSNAEIWWCLRTAMNNHSAKSNSDIDFYFKKMLADPIVQKFSCGETKTMYMMVFGIAPHFRSLLLDQVADEPYALLFDESLNKSLGLKQLDMHLRFWLDGQVHTRYLDSKMLGHSTASDLLDALNSSSHTIPFKNLVQLSMDGPNVNWALYDKLKQQLKDDHDTSLMNVGSCGLHQLHNALRKGMEATGWDLQHILSSAYFLFKDVPARRDDYTRATGSTIFPLKYCAHRWVENLKVMMRLKEMLPNLKVCMTSVKEKKSPNPNTKSFEAMKSFIDDPKAEMKLAFSISMCRPVEQFLVTYQTDAPMIPFLFSDLSNLITVQAKRVVKPDVLASYYLKDLDLFNSDKLLDYTKVNIGTEAAELLKKLKCSPKEVIAVRTQCRDALVEFVSKILKKSPIIYSLTEYLQFCNPSFVMEKPTTAVKHLKSALLHVHHCSLGEIDEVLEQFEHFVASVKTKDSFLNFTIKQDRVDVLFYQEMGIHPTYEKLWGFVKKCFVVSHGQATVEHGFSENKAALETNMGEETLIARRTIKDHIRAIGGIGKFEITKKLKTSCSLAHRRYLANLEEKKVTHVKSLKRKHVEEDVLGLKKRRLDLQENVKYLEGECDKQSEKAESVSSMKEQLALFTTANALRKSAKLKKDEIKVLDKELEEKQILLRSL